MEVVHIKGKRREMGMELRVNRKESSNNNNCEKKEYFECYAGRASLNWCVCVCVCIMCVCVCVLEWNVVFESLNQFHFVWDDDWCSNGDHINDIDLETNLIDFFHVWNYV